MSHIARPLNPDIRNRTPTGGGRPRQVAWRNRKQEGRNWNQRWMNCTETMIWKQKRNSTNGAKEGARTVYCMLLERKDDCSISMCKVHAWEQECATTIAIPTLKPYSKNGAPLPLLLLISWMLQERVKKEST
jgi:hypothetical protein